MTVWEMPKPPGPEITAVWDGEGVEFIRARADGSTWRDACGPISWESLVWRQGPISDVPPSEQE